MTTRSDIVVSYTPENEVTLCELCGFEQTVPTVSHLFKVDAMCHLLCLNSVQIFLWRKRKKQAVKWTCNPLVLDCQLLFLEITLLLPVELFTNRTIIATALCNTHFSWNCKWIVEMWGTCKREGWFTFLMS